MAETLLTGIVTVGAATIAAVASLLGVDRLRSRNGNNKGSANAELIVALQNLTKTTQETRYVQLDRQDREVLVSTANSLQQIAAQLERFAETNHQEHEYLRERLP